MSEQAIELRGLTKSWRGPAGPVRAVRGIDVSIARGETVALLGPNGAGKSTTIDMILGLTRPDGGSVSVFGRAPQESVKAGLVGGMLQTGDLIRNLSVRELLNMVASLYPHPLDVDEALEVAGLEPTAGQTTQKLSGGQTQRVRFAVAIISKSGAADPGRTDGGDGRGGPAHVLAGDASLRRRGFGFPLILYFVIAIPNRHIKDFSGTGVSAALYYMVSLASFGTMMSMVSTGGRIAGERQVGWTRQLRITPLRPRAYLRAKVLTGYLMALLSLVLLCISGVARGQPGG